LPHIDAGLRTHHLHQIEVADADTTIDTYSESSESCTATEGFSAAHTLLSAAALVDANCLSDGLIQAPAPDPLLCEEYRPIVPRRMRTTSPSHSDHKRQTHCCQQKQKQLHNVSQQGKQLLAHALSAVQVTPVNVTRQPHIRPREYKHDLDYKGSMSQDGKTLVLRAENLNDRSVIFSANVSTGSWVKTVNLSTLKNSEELPVIWTTDAFIPAAEGCPGGILRGSIPPCSVAVFTLTAIATSGVLGQRVHVTTEWAAYVAPCVHVAAEHTVVAEGYLIGNTVWSGW
jgi:hypothetical protein